MKTNCAKCQEDQGRRCPCRAQRGAPKRSDLQLYLPAGFALLSAVVGFALLSVAGVWR